MTLPAAFTLHVFDELASTNDTALEYAALGAPDGTIILAHTQTQGRGRQGRVWQSLPGNLNASFIMRADATLAPQLGFVLSLAAADAIKHYAPQQAVTCKWPNDILLNGHKVAGILIESDGATPPVYIAGIGVNLAAHPLMDTLYPVTSLQAVVGSAPHPEEFIITLAQYLLTYQRRAMSDGFAAIRNLWLQRAANLGETITVRTPQQTIIGVFDGLGADGALLLRDGMTTHSITAADVAAL